MKKLLIIFMVLVLCVGLLGCAKTGNENTQSTNTESQNTKATETEAEAESTESTIATEATESTEATEVTNATESILEHPDDGQVTMVWIPTKGGTKYHSKENCSGMESPDQITKFQAEKEGFAPCKKCYKQTA